MERVLGTVKREIGDLNKFKDLAELHEAVGLAIYYYNNKRIHTALRMSPVDYAKRLKRLAFGGLKA